MLAGLPIRSFEAEVVTAESGDEILMILIELPSGVTLRVTESKYIHINSFNVPREHVLILTYPGAGVKRLNMVEPRIERALTSDSNWRYDLYGTLEKVDARVSHSDLGDLYLFDVGEGTVLVSSSLSEHLPASELPFEVGDSLFIPETRMELYDDMQLNV